MQAPAFLPDELGIYGSFATDDDLFEALIRKPSDLVSFFECACADETWREERSKFVRRVLRWAGKSYYLSQLPLSDAQRLVKITQKHSAALKRHLYFRASLFFTVDLILDDGRLLVNSLLFGALSSYFSNLFKRNCFNEWRNEWRLSGHSLSSLRLVEEHVLNGEIQDLWRYPYQDVLSLMRQANDWDLPGLAKECAVVIKRYIDRENVVETILQAHREVLTDWKEDAYEFFNRQDQGLQFLPGRKEELRVDLLNVKQETVELFEAIAPWVTHLTVGGSLSEEPFFEKAMTICPRLIGVDLSGSVRYADQFDKMPLSMTALDVSLCPWLNARHLIKASQRFIRLKELYVMSDAHLNYLAWVELQRFHELNTLHLGYCHQLTNEDLKLIAQACPTLAELNVEECRGVEDQGVVEIVHACRSLVRLNLSRCYQLTNRALLEIGLHAYQLMELDISYCSALSDQALLIFIRSKASLKRLIVTGCGFSSLALEQIRQKYPFLQLIV